MYEIVSIYGYPLAILILLFICVNQEYKIKEIKKDITKIKHLHKV